MTRRAELTGKRFGTLLVLSFAGVKGEKKFARAYWKCLCDCGNTSVVNSADLIGGHVKSCGCGKGPRTHGDTRSPEHRSWSGMKDRCLNSNADRYSFYGGRGIKVCKRWLAYENFLADMGRRPGPGYSLDRINNDGDYEPGNCRWATPTQQARNTRQTTLLEFGGTVKSLGEWADEKGMAPQTLWRRLSLGWDVTRSLTQPLRERAT